MSNAYEKGQNFVKPLVKQLVRQSVATGEPEAFMQGVMVSLSGVHGGICGSGKTLTTLHQLIEITQAHIRSEGDAANAARIADAKHHRDGTH